MATKILHAIDPADQAEVRRVQDLCHKLHLMPPPVAYVGARVYQCPPELLVGGKIPEGLKLDELGIAPALVYDARSQSWVRNAYNIVVQQMCVIGSGEGAAYGAGAMRNKDIAGTERQLTVNFHHIRNTDNWHGGATVTTRGIVVGTGTGAESFEDHALGTVVPDGTGAGQFSYTAQETATASYDAGPPRVWTATLIRYMNNNSGGAIVVGEAGIYVRVYWASSDSNFMLCRDLLAATVNVPDTAQLKVTYTIDSMAYPA